MAARPGRWTVPATAQAGRGKEPKGLTFFPNPTFEEARSMISYAGSPGQGMVAALGVLLGAIAVVVVRRRRKRAGREPAVAIPSAMVDVAEPLLVAPAPAPASVEPRVEAFRVAAR